VPWRRVCLRPVGTEARKRWRRAHDRTRPRAAALRARRLPLRRVTGAAAAPRA